MSRTRISGALLVIFAVSVCADPTGGPFEISSLVGSPGNGHGRQGGGLDLVEAVGLGQGAVSTMRGGPFELVNGFPRGPVGNSAHANADSLSTTRFDTVGGQFLGYSPGSPLSITFSQPMNPASFAGGITVALTQSPFGVAVASPTALPLSFAYDSSTYRVDCTPVSGSLAYNSVYQMTLSSGLMTTGDVPFNTPATYTFSTLASQAQASTLVASDAKTNVSVPPAAIATDYYAVLRVDPLNHPERMDKTAYDEATQKAAESYSDYLKPIPASVREFTAYDKTQKLITGFAKPVTIEIPFSQHGGVVDGTNPPVRAAGLGVWYLDEARKLWVRLPDATVDLDKGVVTAKTTHFTAFALIGTQDTVLDFVRVYPIPFRPNAGDPARYGRVGEGIHFDNLPDSATIKLYTLTGQKVKTILHSGVAEERWQADNDDGQRVASGVYRYVITSGSNKKIGKVMVIW